MKRTAYLTTPQIEERLRLGKVRPTAQRIAICRYVLCDAEHPTAEDVKRWADLNFSKMSLATVYNTLGVLVRAGLLRECRLPHREAVVYDQNLSAHHHFIDDRTGRVEDIAEEAVQVRIRLGGKYAVQNVQVVLRGLKK